ncbi:head GIN domain-containing protein [Sphingomonas lenta]|uniref:DUF2807 domain-containing protein n=1 Tax=Sphingomonas lenta TaxID=1141887 RepID=A0A2A2SFB8_9SPHN|nr:head GIN domain-containing protein [Sphingomonas lenta]PAX07903.1 DUF2807 domain-containing protein [Sphingomonas lenta]
MRILGLLVMLPLIACSAGKAESGEAAEARGRGPTRDYDVSGFTAVNLRGADDVEVRVGPGFSVRAQGPEEELDRLEIVRDGDTLQVGRKRGSGWNWGKSEGVTVFVTMPSIAAVGLAGSGDLAVDRVDGERFKASLAGSGNLSLGALRVEDAELSLAGSGDLTGAGVARRLAVKLAGSGDVDARQLTASEAVVSLAGSGDVRATVNGPVNVNLVGSGDVELGGDARCTISKRGSGEVRCR